MILIMMAEKLLSVFEKDIEKLEMKIILIANNVFIKSRAFEKNIWKYTVCRQ